MPSRQSIHQKKRRTLGLCAACGTPSEHYRCRACRKDQRERKRSALGFAPKRKKGKGRPIIK